MTRLVRKAHKIYLFEKKPNISAEKLLWSDLEYIVYSNNFIALKSISDVLLIIQFVCRLKAVDCIIM